MRSLKAGRKPFAAWVIHSLRAVLSARDTAHVWRVNYEVVKSLFARAIWTCHEGWSRRDAASMHWIFCCVSTWWRRKTWSLDDRISGIAGWGAFRKKKMATIRFPWPSRSIQTRNVFNASHIMSTIVFSAPHWGLAFRVQLLDGQQAVQMYKSGRRPHDATTAAVALATSPQGDVSQANCTVKPLSDVAGNTDAHMHAAHSAIWGSFPLHIENSCGRSFHVPRGARRWNAEASGHARSNRRQITGEGLLAAITLTENTRAASEFAVWVHLVYISCHAATTATVVVCRA